MLVKRKSRKRGSLTLVAMVCDDSSLQPVLPQFIIGNQNILRVADLKELDPMLPENIIVVRAKSSWITTELLIVVLEQLRRRLDNHRVAKSPVLLMDGCPVHLQAQVWKAARRLQILLCFVPAALTWLLQPLDVKILNKLKAFVRSEYRKKQIEKASALVTTVDVIKIWVTAIRKVLQGHAWGDAFDECGYSQDAASVMSAIRSIFSKADDCNCETPDAQPTEQRLLHILPTKRKYDFKTLLWSQPATTSSITRACAMPSAPLVKRSATHASIPASSSSAVDHGVCVASTIGHTDAPIAMRTRSHSVFLADSPLHSSGPTAPAALASEPCPSSMLLVAPTAAGLDQHRPRLRARAVPPASKQRF